MYSITEILLIQFCMICFLNVFKPKLGFSYVKQLFIFLNGRSLKEKMTEMVNFYNFICEHNPLLLDYYDEPDVFVELKDKKKKELNPKEKYENKYLEKFKKFPNEFRFTEDELNQEKEELIKIQDEHITNRFNTINSIQKQLWKIKYFEEIGNKRDDNDLSKTINGFDIDCLLNFFDIKKMYDESPGDFNIENMYNDFVTNKEQLLTRLDNMEKSVMNNDEMHKKARDIMINKKLDKYIDNYVLECTPLGNICMRYNNDKKSFEYFSNNSIPYRYLEPVGRKYVTTYWCKPLFVDIEEELKNADERFDEKKEKERNKKVKENEDKKNNPRNVLAQLKNYNKESKEVAMKPMKNRSNKNSDLPGHIKANLPNVNNSTERQLLKEKANRYTWEGRLINFCPLKKIDKKNFDKKLTMTYADFKKIQHDQQNKR